MALRKTVSVIVPAFNEAGNITVLSGQLRKLFAGLPYDYELIFVDDGSEDGTLAEIERNAQHDQHIFYVELSRNFGKDQALRAGMAMACGDAVITIDADMQHPPELIMKMLKYWEDGFDVVYTYREELNPHAPFYQRFTSGLFYKVINALSDIELENGISDYRLMDAKVVDQLVKLDEHQLFLRGMVKWLGFKQFGFPYLPSKRYTGKASYSFLQLLIFALTNIMSFSPRPLYVVSGIGLGLAGIGLLYFPYILFSYVAGYAVPGWTSTIATIGFLGGIQVFFMSMISIYIGKLFMQSKHRPGYLVRSTNVIPEATVVDRQVAG